MLTIDSAVFRGFKFSQTEMSTSVLVQLIGVEFICRDSETVLSVLVRSFKFSRSEKEIYWNMAPAYYPTVGRDSNKPAMYLKVEAL